MWVLDYSDTYGSVFPVLAILIVFGNKVPKTVVILFWYFIVSIILFGYSNYLADRRINNLFIYHLFSIIEITLLLYFFKQVIKIKSVTIGIKWIILLFLIISVLNFLFLESSDSLNSNTLSIEFLVIIIFCSIYYFKFSQSDQIVVFHKQPYFWIVTGFFVYFTTTLLVFSLYKYTVTSYRSFIFDFWIFQEVMYIIKNLLIAYGILCFRKIKLTSH